MNHRTETALVAGVPIPWCHTHQCRRDPDTRICPKCGPRVVDTGQRFHSGIPDNADAKCGNHCPRCAGKYHVCSCRIPLPEAAKALREPEGADREGWASSDVDGLPGYRITGTSVRVWLYASGWYSGDMSNADGAGLHITLLAAQQAAEQMAADTREGWDREGDAFVGPESMHCPLVVKEGGKWQAWNLYSDPPTDSFHPSAITAMLACEKALA